MPRRSPAPLSAQLPAPTSAPSSPALYPRSDGDAKAGDRPPDHQTTPSVHAAVRHAAAARSACRQSGGAQQLPLCRWWAATALHVHLLPAPLHLLLVHLHPVALRPLPLPPRPPPPPPVLVPLRGCSQGRAPPPAAPPSAAVPACAARATAESCAPDSLPRRSKGSRREEAAEQVGRASRVQQQQVHLVSSSSKCTSPPSSSTSPGHGC